VTFGTVRKLSLLIVGDHEIVRKGIRALLEPVPHMHIAGEASTAAETIQKVEKLRPDLVLLDLAMPVLEAIQAIHRARNETKVLVLTLEGAGRAASEVLGAGATGLVLKSGAPEDLVRAIEAISQDRPFVSVNVAQMLLKAIDRKQEPARTASLTAREMEVLKLLAEGRSSKEASAVLRISPRTVDAHRANIMQKLNLHSRSELIHYAVRNGIVDL